MAFSSTITKRPVSVGYRRESYGTFTNASAATGGDIDTGLRSCESIQLQYTGSAVVANAAVVNETLPCDGSAVTIVTHGDACGIWIAQGY